MQIFIEFTGIAVEIIKQKQITLALENQMTYQEILQWLSIQYPGLIGLLIDHDGHSLLSSNLFIINGDLTQPAMVLSKCPSDGDRLILMSLISGGG